MKAMSSSILAIFGYILIAPPIAIGDSKSFGELSSSTELPVTASEAALGVVSRRTIQINPESLRQASPAVLRSPANREDVAGQPEAVTLTLPGVGEVQLVPNRAQSYVPGVETFSGTVADTENGWFTLSIEREKAFGLVKIGAMNYDIRYVAKLRSHVLSETDVTRMPRHAPNPLHGGNSQAPEPDVTEPVMQLHSSINGAVRVLILYANDVPYITTLSSNIISELNNSLFDDGVDPDYHFVLAGKQQLSSNLDEVCKEEVLAKMENENSPFGSILSWQGSYDADVVLTLKTADPQLTQQDCGVAYGGVGGQASELLESTMPYAVSMDSYALGDLTAHHELGHVMGGHHSTVTNAQMAQHWPHVAEEGNGIIGDDGDWQSIMGSYDENGCSFSTTLPNTDCVRIPRWSDPSKTYSGEDRGVTGEKDMILALATQMQTVAAWDSYPYSAPGAPTNFEWQPGQCYGLRTATWDEPSNTDVNQLFLSFFSNFSNPSIIYHGVSDLAGVNVSPGGTRYVRVRSCNGSGCGPFSSTTLEITYQGSCDPP